MHIRSIRVSFHRGARGGTTYRQVTGCRPSTPAAVPALPIAGPPALPEGGA